MLSFVLRSLYTYSVDVQAVEEGPGYAMHILSFGNDADPPSRVPRKRTAAPKETTQPSKPPRKRRRISVSFDVIHLMSIGSS